MHLANNSISIFVEDHFPSIYRTDGPDLVSFVKTYYEWLESFENPVYTARKLHEYRDVDLIPDKFFDFIRREFMKSIPTNATVDHRLLLKNITDFYRAKGTEKAYRLLFRILYNEDITIYYPGQDMLRASDGRWVVERSIIGELLIPISDFSGLYTIHGEEGFARIERTIQYFSEGAFTTEIFISNVKNGFSQGEFIKDVNDRAVARVISDGLIEYPGGYVGTHGFLSWDKYLQDNHYYQEFSYEIQSSSPLSHYRKAVNDLVHPGGTKLFGSILIDANLDLSNWFVNLSITLQEAGSLLLYSIIGLYDGYNFAGSNWLYGPGSIDINTRLLFQANSTNFSSTFNDDDIVRLVANSNHITYKKIADVSSTTLIPYDPYPFNIPDNVTYQYKNGHDEIFQSFITKNNEFDGVGTVDVLAQDTIQFWGNTSLIDLHSVQLADFDGTARIVRGTGTFFTSNIYPGYILDIGNFREIVTTIPSDDYLVIKEPHESGEVSNQTYKYIVV